MSKEQDTKEIYSMEITETGFVLKITEALYQFFIEVISNPDMISILKEIPIKADGKHVTFHINLPFIDFSKGGDIDWINLGKIADQFNFLFVLTAFLLPDEKDFLPSYYLSDDVQLMSILAAHREDVHSNACAIEVNFSQKAYNLLRETYQKDTVIPLCEEKAIDTYLGLSSRSKASFKKEKSMYLESSGGPFGLRAMVKAGGIPSFTVPGNCACLSNNSDEFEFSRDLNSHNLDTPLQQMTMLTSLVTFWNEVLKPLHLQK